jgi:hypothetical protein
VDVDGVVTVREGLALPRCVASNEREPGGGAMRVVGSSVVPVGSELESANEMPARLDVRSQARNGVGLGAGFDEDHHVARCDYNVERGAEIECGNVAEHPRRVRRCGRLCASCTDHALIEVDPGHRYAPCREFDGNPAGATPSVKNRRRTKGHDEVGLAVHTAPSLLERLPPGVIITRIKFRPLLLPPRHVSDPNFH